MGLPRCCVRPFFIRMMGHRDIGGERTSDHCFNAGYPWT
jgi:hypothetical protein